MTLFGNAACYVAKAFNHTFKAFFDKSEKSCARETTTKPASKSGWSLPRKMICFKGQLTGISQMTFSENIAG